MDKPIITQKMVETFTKVFNESLSEMTFQEVVNLALTGYISKEIDKAYHIQQKLLWATEENPVEKAVEESQEAIS